MKPVDDKNKYLSTIKKIITFRFMDETDLERIVSMSDLLIFEEGEQIINQGEINQDFYAVVQGNVKVSVTEENGQDVYICTIGNYEVFGEAGAKTVEIDQTLYHLRHGRYSASMANPRVGKKAFFLSLVDREVRRSFLAFLKSCMKHPRRVFDDGGT